jgi:stage II sporulation protein M
MLTKTAIKKNLVLSLMLWFAGTTIIGIPIVLGIILFRGGALGFSIASAINTLGLGKGLSFSILAMFLQNIILIPAIITIGVSSLNLYKTIVKNRKKQNIKIAIFKHTILSLAMLGIMILSAIIEINVSCKILQNFIKYF